ncbi:MAG: hypothetical protein K0Q83_4374 [Deltaproteobacteria bacterium]|nr:hypothetical protein [Deltaproteobacteria bacterium]
MTTIHTQLMSFTTTDDETLHGLLFTPADKLSDLALLFVHGVAMNFYLPPLAVFGQAIAERDYHGFGVPKPARLQALHSDWPQLGLYQVAHVSGQPAPS